MKLIIYAMIFNFFSTWYFGWNMYPQSDLERASDHLCMTLVTLGLAQIMWRRDMKDKERK